MAHRTHVLTVKPYGLCSAMLTNGNETMSIDECVVRTEYRVLSMEYSVSTDTFVRQARR